MITIAKFTLLEALRNRLPLPALAALIILFGLAAFVGELAVTEAGQTQALLLASALRWFAVMTMSLFVIASLARERHDKGLEMLLSLPLSRARYYFGKLLGYVCISLMLAVCLSLPLPLFANAAAVALWCVSLCCELSLIVSLSLVSLFTFTHVTSAYVAVTMFYVSARSIGALRALSAGPLPESATWTQEGMRLLMEGIAMLLPDLSVFTNSAWLVHGARGDHLSPVIAQTAIYLVILIAAGLFDLYRKSL